GADQRDHAPHRLRPHAGGPLPACVPGHRRRGAAAPAAAGGAARTGERDRGDRGGRREPRRAGGSPAPRSAPRPGRAAGGGSRRPPTADGDRRDRPRSGHPVGAGRCGPLPLGHAGRARRLSGRLSPCLVGSSRPSPVTARADERPTSHHVRVRDLTLRYLDFGGDGAPLLFLHATGFHAWVWAPYVDHFRATHRVLALDQRGHGESDKPPTGYRWEEFGADLAAFLDVLSLERVDAVGHSKGGTAIAAAAAAGTTRVARAVLIEPVLFAGPIASAPIVESPLAAGPPP